MHVVAAIYKNCEELEKYMNPYYLKSTYIDTYAHVIHGIRKEDNWFNIGLNPLQPPPSLKQLGRPKDLRIKEVGDVIANCKNIGMKMKQIFCSTYGKEGHNKQTCEQRKALKEKINQQVIFFLFLL